MTEKMRIILLSFIYFYLLLIAGAFGNVVVSTAIVPPSLPRSSHSRSRTKPSRWNLPK